MLVPALDLGVLFPNFYGGFNLIVLQFYSALSRIQTYSLSIRFSSTSLPNSSISILSVFPTSVWLSLMEEWPYPSLFLLPSISWIIYKIALLIRWCMRKFAFLHVLGLITSDIGLSFYFALLTQILSKQIAADLWHSFTFTFPIPMSIYFHPFVLACTI